MNNYYNQEKNKYDKAWSVGAENDSRCAYPMANYIIKTIPKSYKILDIGCGSGLTTQILRSNGYNVTGVDITLKGLDLQHKPFNFGQPIPERILTKEGFYQAPIWDMPFKDNEFDFTFSTDVLEHLPPEMVISTIKEIYRVTKIETYHCIATFRDNRHGFIFHLSVEHIIWWKKQFDQLNKNNITTEIINRKEFLKLYG